MKDILFQAVGIAFLSVICDLMINDGNLKKYIRLVIGFLMMSVLIKPIDVVLPKVDFEKFNYTEFSEEQLMAESDAIVLGMHKDNIEEYLRSTYNLSGKIFIELFSDGNVKAVSFEDNLSNESLIEIKNSLNCENVYVLEG